MRTRFIAYAVTMILRSINPEDVKALVDDLLDRVEDRYATNPTVMGFINLARQSFNIPDDIGGDED